MATIERFEDLRVWQQARLLAKAIYLATGDSKLSRDFVLRDQMRRAAVSILSNIAEGFDRNGTREFMQFLSIAKASAGELRAQLYLAADLAYIDKHRFEDLSMQTSDISKMIAGLLTYLKNNRSARRKYEASDIVERYGVESSAKTQKVRKRVN